MEKRKTKSRDRVVHPDYGKHRSRPTGNRHLVPDFHNDCLGNNIIEIYYETAMPADKPQMGGSWSKADFYFDMLLVCRSCDREFIYYAREHARLVATGKRYFAYAPHNCIECRKDRGQLKKLRKHYDVLKSELFATPVDLNDKYTLTRHGEFLDIMLILLDADRLKLTKSAKVIVDRFFGLSRKYPKIFDERFNALSRLLL